mmetsp:Transcript_20643/g.45556  ORF Transcript_20643/g.45556 Transcript_20643/m.45556 type:complete len:278 (+) Transcript_20643:550-1383(+)
MPCARRAASSSFRGTRAPSGRQESVKSGVPATRRSTAAAVAVEKVSAGSRLLRRSGTRTQDAGRSEGRRPATTPCSTMPSGTATWKSLRHHTPSASTQARPAGASASGLRSRQTREAKCLRKQASRQAGRSTLRCWSCPPTLLATSGSAGSWCGRPHAHERLRLSSRKSAMSFAISALSFRRSNSTAWQAEKMARPSHASYAVRCASLARMPTSKEEKSWTRKPSITSSAARRPKSFWPRPKRSCSRKSSFRTKSWIRLFKVFMASVQSWTSKTSCV